MSIGVSVRATKFTPDSYRGQQSGQSASGCSCEDWRKLKRHNIYDN